MVFKGILEIKPRYGLSDLRFGATMVEAQKYFGKPESVENIDEIEEYKSIVWHYLKHGFSLFFDDSLHNTFSCVELDEESSLLWDTHIFKMSEKEIIKLFKEKGFKEMETEEHEWGERRVSFDDAILDLYFEKDKLVSVNYCIPQENKNLKIFSN